MLVPDAKYLLDYDPLPVNQAATLMCSGVTAYGALKRLVDRPRQRNLLLIGLGGVGMMGLSFAQAMFKQKISVADLSPAARESALKNGASVAYDPSEPDVVKRIIKETEGGFDEIVDFAGNEKSMAFAVAVVARGGKIVVSGLMGGNFSLPMVQWVYKRMTIEGFMVGTLAEGHGTDGAGARRQDQADADEGRADGRRPEMDRRTARRQGGRADRAEELNSVARMKPLVARMRARDKLREIRGARSAAGCLPDCASLHPGYDTGCGPWGVRSNGLPDHQCAWLRQLRCCSCCRAITAPAAAAEKRIALVVGNSAYQNVARLDNPRTTLR